MKKLYTYKWKPIWSRDEWMEGQEFFSSAKKRDKRIRDLIKMSEGQNRFIKKTIITRKEKK